MVEQLGAEAIFVRTDVSKLAEVEALVTKVISTWGRIDCAFNNAGIDGRMAKLADCTEETWNRTIAVNLSGVFFCMKAEIPHMLRQGGGAIVNTASVAGLTGSPGLPAYVASKHGVVGLTRAAAIEYGREKIRVNCVCPGPIRTPMMSRLLTGRPRWNSASPPPNRSSAWASRRRLARRSRGYARTRPPMLPDLRCKSTVDTWRSEGGPELESATQTFHCFAMLSRSLCKPPPSRKPG